MALVIEFLIIPLKLFQIGEERIAIDCTFKEKLLH
jgi:hypothetical protein